MSAALRVALVLVALLDLGSVDEALEAVASGERLEGRVPVEVARDAAARIGAFTRDPELGALVRVALAGGARDQVGRALLEAVRAQGPGALEAAACLARLADDDRRAVLAAAPPDLPADLRALVEGSAPDADVTGALCVLAGTASADELAQALQAWADQGEVARARGLLEQAGAARQPALAVACLGAVEVGPELTGPLGEALAALVARDEGAAAAAVERVGLGVWGPGGALVRSLGAVRGDLAGVAAALVTEAVGALALPPGDVDDDVLAAIVAAAGEQLVWQVVPTLPGLAADRARGARLRRAAVHALSHVGYRDAPTIDLLVGLLRDPDRAVAAEAHRTLLLKAGVRLDARPELWEAWRRGQALPATPPEPDEARLRRERELRARVGAP